MPKGGGDKPKVQVDADDFPGIFINDEASSGAPGSGGDQVNIKSDQEGSLRVRYGSRLVSFDG